MGKLFLFAALFFVLLAVNQSDCLRCYACGEVNTFMGKNHTNTIPCREFDEAPDLEALERFVIECPSGYDGCITQKQGGQVIRTCETYALDDCQTANGVTYCYCNHDLCNGKLVQNHHAHKEDDAAHQDLSDDEDYSEMSGFGEGGDHLNEGSEEIGIQVNMTRDVNGTNFSSGTSAMNETSRRVSQSNSPGRCIQLSKVLLLILVILWL